VRNSWQKPSVHTHPIFNFTGDFSSILHYQFQFHISILFIYKLIQNLLDNIPPSIIVRSIPKKIVKKKRNWESRTLTYTQDVSRAIFVIWWLRWWSKEMVLVLAIVVVVRGCDMCPSLMVGGWGESTLAIEMM